MTLIIDPIEQEQPMDKGKPAISTQTQKALVGFLFSYSRLPLGEFWPIYEGKNTIGNHKNCDVTLLEQSVSNPHASIFAIRKKGLDLLEFRIQDAGSETSTIVDGEQLMVGDVTNLKDRSTIQIGGYTLTAVLIDYVAEQFAPNPEFKEIAKRGQDFSLLNELRDKKDKGKDSNRTTI
jgi:pSer/pThr/pTyr-binding forkhead associated (FHA) protein